jgi:hypothetical protein
MKIEFTWEQAREAAKTIPSNERFSSIIFFMVFAIGFWYILALKKQDSQFFTPAFNDMDAVALYSFWLVWVITAGLEGILGLRLWSRLFDSFGAILVAALACLWLFIKFPFDFSFFSELLPVNWQWLLSWIGNLIGRIVLFLSFVFHLVAAVYSPFAYKLVRLKGG